MNDDWNMVIPGVIIAVGSLIGAGTAASQTADPSLGGILLLAYGIASMILFTAVVGVCNALAWVAKRLPPLRLSLASL